MRSTTLYSWGLICPDNRLCDQSEYNHMLPGSTVRLQVYVNSSSR